MYTLLIIFALSLLAIAAYIGIREWELRRGVRVAERVRNRLDAYADWCARRIETMPGIAHAVFQSVSAWAMRHGLHIAARAVAALQAGVARVMELLYQRTRRLRTSRTASQFLAHVAEHKRQLSRQSREDRDE